MRSNIKLGLSGLLPIALLALLDQVIAKFTGSILFPAPPLTLAAMNTLSTEFRDAITAATEGSVVARKIRDAKVLEVQDALRATADYVRTVCNGEADKLAQSGFMLSKTPEPINVVAVPDNVAAAATDTPNEVVIRWGRTEGARMFRLERAETDPTAGATTWVPVGQTSRQRLVIGGMEPYKASWFRVIGIGKGSEGFPSDVVLARAA